MGNARVVSVNAGRETAASWAGKIRRTAIDKRPVTGPVHASWLGLGGDEQADQEHHGGHDQALYAYAREGLDFRAGRAGRDLGCGMFGENITTSGLDPNGALIGGGWQLGGGVGRAAPPRVPRVRVRDRTG